MQTTNDTQPTITSVTVKGESGQTVKRDATEYPSITLNEYNPVDILDIIVTKKETGSGKVQVLASILGADGNWSDYQEYTAYLGEVTTQAKSIRFQAVFTVNDIGTDVATLQSIEVRSRTDNVAVFTEGTSVCIIVQPDRRAGDVHGTDGRDGDGRLHLRLGAGKMGRYDV